MADALLKDVKAAVNQHVARESWLLAAVAEMTPWFKEKGHELPPVKVSIGVGTRKMLGHCYWGMAAEDKKTRHIFICPRLTDPLRVLDVLLHELCHAALPDEEKHGARFRKLAISEMGLTGKATATVAEPGSALHDKLAVLSEALGPYPHTGLDPFARKKKRPPQGGWLKYVSKENPETYYLRISPKALEAHGAPLDPDGEEMVPAEDMG